MFFLKDDLPIIALSSGTTNSALALLRISGFSHLSNFQLFFSRDLSAIKPRYSTLCRLLDGEKVLDEVMLTYFAAPHSYTGENILELAVHGNQLNVQRILDFFVRRAGCRLATPGEFTYRALKNQKLSLSQVEGLDQMLNATSTIMLDQGLAAMHGELHREFLQLQSYFLQLKAAVELSIDFLEDIGEEQANLLFHQRLDSFFNLAHSLYLRSQGDLNQLTSPSIVLLGKTNAGKSSFFNFLLKTGRAIVSPVHGTTRDYISEYLFFRGHNFRLVDTAGLRLSADSIEGQGIERSYQQISHAFFRILIINPFDYNPADSFPSDSTPDVIIFTHADVDGFASHASSIVNFFPSFIPIFSVSLVSFDYGPIEPQDVGPIEPTHFGPIEPLTRSQCSAVLQSLVLRKYHQLCGESPVLVQRQRQLLSRIFSQVSEFKRISTSESDMGILSHELLRLDSSLGELMGIITPDQVLASIFSNFCIGK